MINLSQILSQSQKMDFFVGAGISREKPTELISGEDTIRLCCEYFTDMKTVFDNNFKKPSFEQFFYHFSKYFDFSHIIEYYSLEDIINNYHNFFGAAALSGFNIFSLNFDQLIEIKMKRMSSFQKNKTYSNNQLKTKLIISKNDYLEQIGQFQGGLIKLHGSLRNYFTQQSTKESIRIGINDYVSNRPSESLFEFEKYKIFFINDILGDTLCIFGFSGGDIYDVIPFMKNANQYRRILWFEYNSNISSYEAYSLDNIPENVISEYLLNELSQIQNYRRNHGYEIDVYIIFGIPVQFFEKESAENFYKLCNLPYTPLDNPNLHRQINNDQFAAFLQEKYKITSLEKKKLTIDLIMSFFEGNRDSHYYSIIFQQLNDLNQNYAHNMYLNHYLDFSFAKLYFLKNDYQNAIKKCQTALSNGNYTRFSNMWFQIQNLKAKSLLNLQKIDQADEILYELMENRHQLADLNLKIQIILNNISILIEDNQIESANDLHFQLHQLMNQNSDFYNHLYFLELKAKLFEIDKEILYLNKQQYYAILNICRQGYTALNNQEKAVFFKSKIINLAQFFQ